MILEMAKYHKHIPVLLNRAVDLLVTDKSGFYIDATLGGGGHSRAILEATDSNSMLFGIDQDREALDAATERIGNDNRFNALHGNFGQITTMIHPDYHGKINGILFDLGVSTHQIKEPGRGFSFQEEGPLDMRMSEMSGVSAYRVVNEYEYSRLRDIIFHYGEERLSRQIAKAIIENRPVETTAELREIIKSVVYGPHVVKSVARVFQAIRIEVNRELDMLKSALFESLEILKPGGRLVVISYHSLEDRIVKVFFRSGNHEDKVEKDFYGNRITPFEVLTKSVIRPDEDEIKSNPAARSARLRAAQKKEED